MTSDVSSESHTLANTFAANGDTPLHLAMRLSDETQCLAITKLLVEAGCNPCELNADDKSPVHIAVVRGFISVVEYLLSRNVSLPSRILFAALQATPVKRVEMIRLLINKGADVNVLSPNGYSLLHVAMRSPDGSVFAEIVDVVSNARRNNPLAPNRCGETALWITEEQDYRTIATFLLRFATSSDILSLMAPPCPSERVTAFKSLVRHANDLHIKLEAENRLLQAINQCLDDEDQYLVLIKKVVTVCDELRQFESAVQRGFCRVVEYLLSQRMPFPPRILATALRSQPSMVSFLIGKGADVHVREANEDTLLHIAIRSMSEESLCCVVLQVLVEAGCSIFSVNTDKERPLHVAIARGFISVVKYFLSLTPPDRLPLDLLSNISPLRLTGSMVLFLLGHGVAHDDVAGNGLLHRVIKLSSDEEECLKAIQFFVQSGYRHFEPNASEETPLHISIKRVFASVSIYLISLDVPLSSDILDLALKTTRSVPDVAGQDLREEWKSLVSSLIYKGAVVQPRKQNGDTLVHHVIRSYSESESLAATKLLVEVNYSICIPNANGELPLEIAAIRSLHSVVEYLLLQDIPVPRDILLVTLRRQRKISEIPRMVSLLVQHGADVSVCATNGDSVLHVILARKHYRLIGDSLLQVVKTLVRLGCNPRAHGSTGRTPLEIATSLGYSNVKDYLFLSERGLGGRQ